MLKTKKKKPSCCPHCEECYALAKKIGHEVETFVGKSTNAEETIDDVVLTLCDVLTAFIVATCKPDGV